MANSLRLLHHWKWTISSVSLGQVSPLKLRCTLKGLTVTTLKVIHWWHSQKLCIDFFLAFPCPSKLTCDACIHYLICLNEEAPPRTTWASIPRENLKERTSEKNFRFCCLSFPWDITDNYVFSLSTFILNFSQPQLVTMLVLVSYLLGVNQMLITEASESLVTIVCLILGLLLFLRYY